MQTPQESEESFKPSQLQEEKFLNNAQDYSPIKKSPTMDLNLGGEKDKRIDFQQLLAKRSSTRKNLHQQNTFNESPTEPLKRILTFTVGDQSKKRINDFIESFPVTMSMTIVTIYALFGDDIRQLSSTKDTQSVFYTLTIICMIFFTIEIILNCIAKPDYIFGFYFWLDVIATVSMLLDIGWITNAAFGSESNASALQIKKIGLATKSGRRAGQVIRVIRLVRLVKLYKQANLQLDKEYQRKEFKAMLLEQQSQRTSKTSYSTPHRQTTKLIQFQPEEDRHFVDLLKLDEPIEKATATSKIPLMLKRVVPENPFTVDPYNMDQPRFTGNRVSEQSPDMDRSPPAYYNQKRMSDTKLLLKKQLTQAVEQITQNPIQTKVGQALSESTMRRVITIILSIVISIPIFDYSTYKEDILSYQTGLDRIYQFESQPNLFNLTIVEYINFHAGLESNIIYIYINQSEVNPTCCSYDSQTAYSIFNHKYPVPRDLRDEDLNLFLSFDTQGNLKGYTVLDVRDASNINAGLSMIRTVFVCCVLGFSAVIFSKDVQGLVLDPIERMLKKVDRIAKNPLEAAQFEEQEELILEELEDQHNQTKIDEQKEQSKMETAILEKLIMKIGALLAVGFGEAGSEIIAANMSQGGEVDPMLPGKKMLAIFGFCDIRNFTDATEVLQTGVMVFVNEIAEIVHGTVDHYNGSANKNIGDAFLLVWKFKPNEYGVDEDDPKKLRLYQSKRVQQQADLSVIAFLKIITGITISSKLEKYKQHPGLNARLANYSVKMGFGLHLGWAIEGAIGSNYKIDASYLSPNVNMASRLEAATKQFGSSILISGILRDQLTPKCQKHLRHIDTVTVKGSIEPVEIHCVDISYKTLLTEVTQTYDNYDIASLKKEARKRFRVGNRLKRDQLKDQVYKDLVDVADEFDNDIELKAIRSVYTREFYELWDSGFKKYLSGDWPSAKQVFLQTLEYIPDHRDGPSNTLLQVIEDEGGKAPSSWEGFRELTEK